MKIVIPSFVLLFCIVSLGCNSNQTQPNVAPVQAKTELDILNENVRASKGDPEQLLKRASYFYEESQFDEALADLFLVIQKDSTHLQAHHLLADVYLQSFQSQLALRTLERASGLYPDSTQTLLKLAEYQLILKQYDQAKESIGNVMNLDLQNADALFLLGLIYKEQNDPEKAIAAFQSAVEMNPELTDAWLILGNYMEEINSPLAGQYYENAVRMDPENISALHSQAFFLQNHDGIDEAISIYDHIKEIDSSYVDAYLNTGILLILKNDVSSAMEQFESLIRMDSTNALAHFYIGRSFELMEQPEKAVSAYNEALRWSPSMERAKEAIQALEI